MIRLTRKQLYKALNKNKYLAVRYCDGDLVGINCGIVRLERFNNFKEDNTKTNIVGFYPITFQEYLTIKSKFC